MGVPTQFSPKNKCVSNDLEWLKMDFKHNFKKDDIFNFFYPPPKMTNVIFFFLMKASLRGMFRGQISQVRGMYRKQTLHM